MRKLYSIFTFMLFAGIAFAQTYQGFEAKNPDFSPVMNQFKGSAIDLPFNNISLGERKSSSVQALKLDTLTDIWDRKTGSAIYGFTSGGNTYPLCGTNGIYYFAGEKFTYSGTANLVGCMISYAMLNVPTNYDSAAVLAFQLDSSNMLPSGSPFAQTIFRSDVIDTSSTTPIFTFIPLDKTGSVPSFFALFVQTRTATNFYVIQSNMQGDGKGENRACMLALNNNQQLYGANFSQININMQDGNKPNFDVYILPVIETNTTGINDGFNISGADNVNFYPNPATVSAQLSMNLKFGGDMKIAIHDSKGKVVRSFNYNVIPGLFSQQIDLSGLASGAYFYSVVSGSTHFAGKFIIK